MKNSIYWQKRLEKLTNSLMLSQERNTLTFLKAYKSSLTEVQAYVNLLYAKYSTDGVLSMAEMYKFNRFKSMEKEIASIISDLGKQEKTFMTNELKNTYKASYAKTGAILTVGIPKLAINFSKIPTGFVEKALTYPWSGSDFITRIGVNNNVLISNLRQTLTRGFINGSSITNMSKDLKSVMDIGATNVRRLVRTEAAHVISASHHDVYKQAGVLKVKLITANDNRTCEECSALNNKVYLIDEAPMLPLHSNGRCVLLPYFED